MDKFKLLSIERRGHTAVVTMLGEKVNALTTELLTELYDAFADIETDRDVWAVVLCSGRKLFAAGADLKALISEGCEANMASSEYLQRTFLKIENFPHPVIAAVNGVAYGGGLELALCCDIRVFDVGTKIAFPECGLGIIPGAGGTQRLTGLIGPGRTKRLIYTGEVILAPEAYSLGICEYFVEEESCLEKALAVAESICSKAPLAIAESKKCIAFAEEHGLEEGLCFERRAGSSLFDSYDKKEGITAFFEKRRPLFRNE